MKANIGVPVTPALKALTFDRFVKSAGKKLVRNVSVETITATGTNEYVISNSDYDGQIIKVERNGLLVPFVGEKNASLNGDSSTVARLGYWTRHKTDVIDTIFSMNADNPTIVSTPLSHGLTTGEFIRISQVNGFLSSTGALSEVNGITHKITESGSPAAFTIDINSISYSISEVGNSGLMRYDMNQLLFNKDAEGTGGDINVYYYSAPRAKSSIDSEVDVPDLLIWSALYDTIAEFLNLDVQLQLASGYRGLAKNSRDAYSEESRNREPSFDRMILPMQEFIEA